MEIKTTYALSRSTYNELYSKKEINTLVTKAKEKLRSASKYPPLLSYIHWIRSLRHWVPSPRWRHKSSHGISHRNIPVSKSRSPSNKRLFRTSGLPIPLLPTHTPTVAAVPCQTLPPFSAFLYPYFSWLLPFTFFFFFRDSKSSHITRDLKKKNRFYGIPL